MKKSIDKLMELARQFNKVVIVGAGGRGKELLKNFKKNNIDVYAFFDNNAEKMQWKNIDGVPVEMPLNLNFNDVLYVTSVADPYDRGVLLRQLLQLGISRDSIFEYDPREYEYMSHLDEHEYREIVDDRYYQVFGMHINWENPTRYTEKICCDKLVRSERKSRLTDKYLVKDWVQEQIGTDYCVKLLGVWDSANDIDFESLPQKFVLKLNNASASNIVVTNKETLDIEQVRNRLNAWMTQNYAYRALELHYGDINPKIICEEYIPGLSNNIYDYKFYCFHGVPRYIECIKSAIRYSEAKATFFDNEWNEQEFILGYPKLNTPVPRPNNLNKMLDICSKLSRDLPHVRVDLYDMPDGRILFGEMTFTTWGGLMRFSPDKWDYIFGSLI